MSKTNTSTNTIKMTVVVPTHGRVALFKSTLQSLLEQTSNEFEIIVTDDTENLLERNQIQDYVKEFTEKGLLIKYIFTKPNLLQAPNTNQGLNNANTDYIRILHSDDLLSPECIQREIKFLEKNKDIDLIYHNTIPFQDEEDLIFNNFYDFKKIDPRTSWLNSSIFTCTIIPSCLCFKKSLINKLGGLNEEYKFLCDWELFFKFLLDAHKNNKKIGWLNDSSVGWRVHDNSVTGTMQLTHFYEHEKFINSLVSTYRNEKLLTNKDLNKNIQKAEEYRYKRIMEESQMCDNFECPYVPMKYRFKHTLKIEKYVLKLNKHLNKFMNPILSLLKWCLEPFAIIKYLLKILINIILYSNRLLKK